MHPLIEVVEPRRLLAGVGSITGTIYNDANGNGRRDAGEGPASAPVYLDLNHDAAYTSGEPRADASSTGEFRFTGVAAGPYAVRVWNYNALTLRQTGPANNAAVNVTVPAGGTATASFGVQPLYGVFATVFNDTNRNGVWDTQTENGFGRPNTTVYVDANHNATLDAGDTVLPADASEFRLAVGTYSVRADAKPGYQITTPAAASVTVTGPSVQYLYFGVAPGTAPASASLSGVTFDDTDRDGRYDTGETKTSDKTVFLDTNTNGRLDAGEKSVKSDANGAWRFAGLAAGTYHVRRVFGSGYTPSTTPIDVTLSAGQSVSGLSIGSKSTASTPTNTASISGFAFDDADRDGTYDKGETLASGKTIFLDLDDDGVKDASEPSVVTDSAGTFNFTGLAARTYHVRRIFSNGYVESTPARTITLTSGQDVTGVSIGSKTK